MEYRRRTVAGNDWGVRSRQRGARRLSCPDGVHQPLADYDDDDSVNNNNNNNGGASAATNANDTTALVDELERLRTDNFQLRLRVYNAERRVDRLSASAARRRDGGSDSSDAGSSSASDDDDDGRALAAAKATAGAAVRTVHDLLTVNRRLLALLAAAVSAKAVAVTADDKRRWQKLRHCVEHCGVGAPQIEEDEEVEKANDDGDGSATEEEDVETHTSAQRLDASEGRATKARHVRLRSPPPPPPPPPPLEPDAPTNDDDDAGGSELVRLRARCRRLERSLQQLVNTELWARNRQIGKLEQQRYVTQVQQQAQKERRSAAVAPQQSATAPAVPVATKGILVKKSSPPLSPPVKEPVLPDYSEVNFFYSCDEDDADDDDDEDNEDDDRGNDSETNALSSTEEETQSGNEPVKLSATVAPVGAPLASSSPRAVCGSQKRQRRRRRPKNDASRTAEASSSTESLSVTAGDSTDAVSSSRRCGHRIAGLRRRRRCGGPRRGSTCGRRCDAETRDAQVQCDGTGAGDGDDDQAGLLRRELEARRRENCRLYDMLLRLQRDRGSKTAGRPEERATAACSSSDRDDDDDGSPEPYGRAARAVRGRIADLLRPSAGPTANSGSAAVQTDRDEDEQTVLRLQQQQQLLLLARLRERIVAYERQELLDGGGGHGDGVRVDGAPPAEDRDNAAVEHMDRAALVNVALPRAVDRLRRALVPLLQHQRQQKRSPSPSVQETVRATAERDSSVG